MPSHTSASLVTVGFSRQTHPLTVPAPRVLLKFRFARDMPYGGGGKIVGTTKKDALPSDIPVSRRVRLIHEQSGVCIRETWSRASDGEYRFENIALGVRWTVIAYDHTEADRAE